jgi:protein subunit release factor B
MSLNSAYRSAACRPRGAHRRPGGFRVPPHVPPARWTAQRVLDIQAGAGGTEAQDWAQMLLRMYLRWAERARLQDRGARGSPGEVAGIKSATIKSRASTPTAGCAPRPACTAWCASRRSTPGNRRHTSFASVFVSPEVDDDIEIEINPADLRIDVYRSSGAGGQHVNKTESAVRITHMPTGHRRAVPERALQHKNRATAMKHAAAKLYELEHQKRNASGQGARGLQDRHRLGQPDPLLRARPVAHQGPAHRRRDRQHRPCSTATSTSSSRRA